MLGCGATTNARSDLGRAVDDAGAQDALDDAGAAHDAGPTARAADADVIDAGRHADVARALHFVVDTSDESVRAGVPASTVMRFSIFAAAFDRVYAPPSSAPPVLGLTMFPARSLRTVVGCSSTAECPPSSHCTSEECEAVPIHHGLCDACMFDQGAEADACSQVCSSGLECPGRWPGTLSDWYKPRGPTFCISNFDCANPTPPISLPLDPSRDGPMLASTLAVELPGGPIDIRPAYVSALADAERFVAAGPVGLAAVVLVLARSTMSLADRCAPRGDLAVLAGKAAARHVRTFVLAQGPIPAPGSLARNNLDAIAVAGGTDHARIVACDDLACPALDAELHEIRTMRVP